MVHQPPVLVLDEPTAGVDVALGCGRELIRELNAGGVTIILTTHYLEEAQALCDRIAIINHGGLITEENTATLLKGMGSKSLVLTLTGSRKATAALADMQVQLEGGGSRSPIHPTAQYRRDLAAISRRLALPM